jgi:hypothetical protein
MGPPTAAITAAMKRLDALLSDVPPAERKALVQALLAARRASVSKAIDQAQDNVSDHTKAEIAKLSDDARKDLRLRLLEELGVPDRDMWASMFAIQSSEKTSSKLTFATWGMVVSTIGLVIVTIVLVVVTAMGSSATAPGTPTPSPARAPVCAIVPEACA